MAAAAGPLMKLSSMPECCITSLPALFTTKTSHPFLSKPIKHRIPSLSTSFPSWVSVKSRTVSLVARTSDWAQEEENNPIDGFKWGGDTEGEEVGGDRIGDFGDGEGTYAVPSEEAKVFVGNLHYDMDSEKLAQLFDQAGVVEVSEVIYNRETDQSRGFAFVTMSNVEEAEKAVEMFNGYEINGRALSVNKAAPRGSRPERPPRAFESSFKVYVGNLSWEVDDARLEQVFSEHGKVVEAKVVYNRDTGRSRGFAFVTMASETELNDAIAALDGQTLDGRTLRINIAENRSPRRGSF